MFFTKCQDLVAQLLRSVTIVKCEDLYIKEYLLDGRKGGGLWQQEIGD